MDKTIQHGGAQVAYQVAGQGSALMLIHGTGGTYQNTWGGFVEQLSSSFHTIAPNYGLSEIDSPLDIDDIVEQHVAAALQEGIQRFHVVGYSLGSVIAATLAAKYPDHVLSLTLIAGWAESDIAAQFQFDLWRKLLLADRQAFAQFLMHTGFSPSFIRNFGSLSDLLPMAQHFASILAEGTESHIDLDARINLRPILNDIAAPSLIIGLTHDQMVPVEQTKELASLIAGAEYREILSGHLVPWENSAALIEEISGFLSRHNH